MEKTTIKTGERHVRSKKSFVVLVAMMMVLTCFSAVFVSTQESSGFNGAWTGGNGIGFKDVESRESNFGEIEITTIEQLQSMGSNLSGKYIQMRDLDFNDPDSYADMEAYLANLGWEIKVEVMDIVWDGSSYYDVTFKVTYKAGNMSSFEPMVLAQIQYMFGVMTTGVSTIALVDGEIIVLGSSSKFDGVTSTAFLLGGTSTDLNVPANDSFAISMFVSDIGDEKTSYHMGNFTSVGHDGSVFNGSYDGNGYSITGMDISFFTGDDIAREQNKNSRGMFGELKSAKIDNVKLLDGSVTSSMINNRNETTWGGIASTTSLSFYGGVAGYATSATNVTNCFNNGTVITSSGAGGVVGYTDSTSGAYYCTNYGDVAVQGCTAAGIVGCGSNVSHSINYGDITSYFYAGGISAYVVNSSGTKITENVNYGNVTSHSNQYTGGIAGNVYSDVSKCVNYGNVIGNYRVGGIVGNTNSNIFDCMNYGDVTVIAAMVGTANATNARMGGIVGETTASVTGSMNFGAVTTSKAMVGGIVGYTGASGSISNNINTGSVTGTSRVGGIAGDCRNQISNSSNSGVISGTTSIGGIVGYTIGSVREVINAEGSIVTATSGEAGGIIGSSSGASVYESANYGDISGSAIAGGIIGKLTAGSAVVVTDCYNLGKIAATTSGGIVGETAGANTITISFAYNFSEDMLPTGGMILGKYTGTSFMTSSELYYTDTLTGGVALPESTPVSSGDFSDPNTFSSSGRWTGSGSTPWTMDPSVNDGMPYFAKSVNVLVDSTTNTEQKVFHGEYADSIGVSVSGTGSGQVAYQWEYSIVDNVWVTLTGNSTGSMLIFDIPTFAHLPEYTKYRCVVTSLVPSGQDLISEEFTIKGFYGFELVADMPIESSGKLEYNLGDPDNPTEWNEYLGSRIMLTDASNLDHLTQMYVRGPSVQGVQGTIGWSIGNDFFEGRTWLYNETITDNFVLTAELGYVITTAVNPLGSGTVEYSIDGSAFLDSDGVELLFGNNTTTVELRAIEAGTAFFNSWSGDTQGISGNTVTLTSVTGPLSYTAHFDDAVDVELIITGGGTVTVVSGGTVESYSAATNVLKIRSGETAVFIPSGGTIKNWDFTGTGSVDGDNILRYTVSTVPETITAVFKTSSPSPPSYVIVSSADSNSTITPSGVVTVGSGNSRTFVFEANHGYSITNVLIDGVDHPELISLGVYTFSNVDANHTISVHSTQLDLVSLEINIEGNGLVEYRIGDSITFVTHGGTIYVEKGTNVTLKAFAGGDSQFVAWESGSFRSTDTQIVFSDVRASMVVVADFEPDGLLQSIPLLWILITILLMLISSASTYAICRRRNAS